VKNNQRLLAISSKDEMNLAEFPFTLLSKSNESQETIEFLDWITVDRKPVKREWIVTGSDKFGLPTAADEELYIALMKVSKDVAFENRRVPIVRYQLAKLLGWGLDGKSYERIEQGLDRLSGVRIKAKNAFWDNAKKKYVTVNFGIIDDYYLYDEKPGKKQMAQEELSLSNFSWNEVLFNSFRAGNIKTVDAEFYFSLKSPVTKRLYRFLDKKKYGGKPRFEIGIKKLSALLPLRDSYPSHIKLALEKSHNELMDKGFIKKVSYEKAKNGEEKVIYGFPKAQAKGQTLGMRECLLPGFSDDNFNLYQQLKKRGISDRVAKALVRDYHPNQVKMQIEIFDWLREQKSPLINKSPAGFLRKSIEEYYEPPKEYFSQHERRSREIEANNRIARWMKYREELIESDIANWDKTLPDDRVAGRLKFWTAGENINGRQPNPEQVERKRQEFIASLPKTDEEKWEHVARNYPEDPPEDFE